MALVPPESGTTTPPIQSDSPASSVADDSQSLDLSADFSLNESGSRLLRAYNTENQTLMSVEVAQSTGAFDTNIEVVGYLCGPASATGDGDVLLTITEPGIYTQINVRDYSLVDLIVSTPGSPGIVNVVSYRLFTGEAAATPVDGGPSHFEGVVNIPTSALPGGASQTVIHALGVFPQVTVITGTGLEVHPQVDHIDVNTIVLTSNVAITGLVVCDSGKPQTTIVSAAEQFQESRVFAIMIAGRE